MLFFIWVHCRCCAVSCYIPATPGRLHSVNLSNDTALAAKTRRMALTASLLYFIFQLLDIATTWLISPELQRESNILVSRFGFGWGFIFLSAGISCLIMPVAQLWLWNNLRQRMPGRRLGYSAFYRSILFKPEQLPSGHHALDIKGTSMAVLLIVLYSLIAAKLFAVIWNGLLLTLLFHVESFALYILLKNLLAGGFGLYMFFIRLYFLQRSNRPD